MASIVSVVTDLIFSMKITSTAEAVGATVKVARSLERLAEGLRDRPSLVLIDLDAEGVDPIEAVRQCVGAEGRPRVIGFVSHVNAERIAAAREAGADQVLARSAFVAKLPALLAEAGSIGKNAPDAGLEN